MTYAVQPAAWQNFDEWGCLWGKDMGHTVRLAQQFGERCIIWVCPAVGNPYPLKYV